MTLITYHQPSGYYPVPSGLNELYYWNVRALEEEVLEQEEYARQCAYEEELAHREYDECKLEWYELQQAA